MSTIIVQIDDREVTREMENEEYVESLHRDGFLEYDAERDVYLLTESTKGIFSRMFGMDLS